MLRAALERRIGEHLGLARRAGQAVAGFVKAREWLQTGRAGLVMEAADGSVDERARLLGALDRPRCSRRCAGAELGAVFGRDHVAHVAVAQGRLAETIRRRGGATGRAGRGGTTVKADR